MRTKKFYNPIKIINIKYPTKISPNKKKIILNYNYWRDIQQIEFSKNATYTPETPPPPQQLLASPDASKEIKLLYFVFMNTITKQIFDPDTLRHNKKTNSWNEPFRTKIITNMSDTRILAVKEKYKAYKSLITNMFLSDTTREQIIQIFGTAQKHYFAISRFSRHVRKYLQIKNNYQHKIATDLSLTPLIEKHKHTFIVYENSNSYLFSISDIVNIIYTSITNAPNFFEAPIHPKNPYTNVPFTIATLYAFFYKVHKMYYSIPQILENYYKCHFNLKWFQIENQFEIRDICIKQYVKKSPKTVIYKEIIDMISEEFYNPKTDESLYIDKEFPIPRLIEIMTPYLYLYFVANYHIFKTEKQIIARRSFKRAVKIFMDYNPNFGERIQEPEPTAAPTAAPTDPQTNPFAKSNQIPRKPLFNDKHPKFSYNNNSNNSNNNNNIGLRPLYISPELRSSSI